MRTHMMKPALLATCLAACGTDMTMPMGDDGPTTEVSGHVTANTAWMDTIHVTAPVTIDPGVTVTVMPGTTINVATSAGITIAGTLDVQGTSAGKVSIKPDSGPYEGLTISSGGTLTMHYGVQVGGGIHLAGTAKATIIDSQMSRTQGDFLTMGGGTLDVEYSSLGLEPGQSDTTHCDMHIGGATTIKVTHSNVS